MNVWSVLPVGWEKKPEADNAAQGATGAFAANLLALLGLLAGDGSAGSSEEGACSAQGVPAPVGPDGTLQQPIIVRPVQGATASGFASEAEAQHGAEVEAGDRPEVRPAQLLPAPAGGGAALQVQAPAPGVRVEGAGEWAPAAGQREEAPSWSAGAAPPEQVLPAAGADVSPERFAQGLRLVAEVPLRRGEPREEGEPAGAGDGVQRGLVRPAETVEVRAADRPAPRPVVEQVIEGLRVQLAADSREIRVALEPPELGEVRIVVRDGDEGVTVRIAVASPLTREALEAGIPQIERALAESGIEVGGFEVWVEGGSADTGDGPWLLPPAEGPVEEEPPRPVFVGPDGVDAVA